MGDYGLFCKSLDTYSVDIDWLNSISTMGFNVFLPRWAEWGANANTIHMKATTLQIKTQMDSVRAVIPDAKFYCWLSSDHPYDPDPQDWPQIGTLAARSSMADAVCNYLSTIMTGSYIWNGILDDTEVHDCNPDSPSSNLYAYYTETANSMKTYTTIPYFPWLYYASKDQVDSDYHAVGLYDSHSYREAPYTIPVLPSSWKGALSTVDAESSISYLIFTIHEDDGGSAGYASLESQLAWWDEVGGFTTYPKCQLFGFYIDYTMDAREFTAWSEWYGTIEAGSVSSGFFEPDKRGGNPDNSGWGTLEAGRLWFNSSTNKWIYWNASTLKALDDT